MPQIILFEKAYAPVQTSLAIRLPDHDVILWHADDTLSNRGTPVDFAQIAPTAAWLSGDVLDGPLLEKFAAVLTRLPALEWVQTANAGLDHPVYQRLEQAGVSISKSGAQSIAIAEYVLGGPPVASQTLRRAVAITLAHRRLRTHWPKCRDACQGILL